MLDDIFPLDEELTLDDEMSCPLSSIGPMPSSITSDEEDKSSSEGAETSPLHAVNAAPEIESAAVIPSMEARFFCVFNDQSRSFKTFPFLISIFFLLYIPKYKLKKAKNNTQKQFLHVFSKPSGYIEQAVSYKKPPGDEPDDFREKMKIITKKQFDLVPSETKSL